MGFRLLAVPKRKKRRVHEIQRFNETPQISQHRCAYRSSLYRLYQSSSSPQRSGARVRPAPLSEALTVFNAV